MSDREPPTLYSDEAVAQMEAEVRRRRFDIAGLIAGVKRVVFGPPTPRSFHCVNWAGQCNEQCSWCRHSDPEPPEAA